MDQHIAVNAVRDIIHMKGLPCVCHVKLEHLMQTEQHLRVWYAHLGSFPLKMLLYVQHAKEENFQWKDLHHALNVQLALILHLRPFLRACNV